MSDWQILDELKKTALEYPFKGVSISQQQLHERGEPSFPRTCTVLGWHVALSQREENVGHSWHLSTMLYPRGRSSTEVDWRVLGHIAYILGAPGEITIMPVDANQLHHWIWTTP